MVRGGVVVELDGKAAEEFDVIDEFIARYGLDLEVAPEAMALDDVALARMTVDVNVPRAEVVRLIGGTTPAKLARVVALLTPVEMQMAMSKMRARRTPSNQAHVTNQLDDPLLIAADAASAVAYGFREVETTVPVLSDAPSNAVALLIGSQVGIPGAMAQCSIEEALELRLGLRGLTSYAETISLYGTQVVPRVRELLGKGAKSVDAVGIELGDKSVLGDKANVKLRFDATYMDAAAKGKL